MPFRLDRAHRITRSAEYRRVYDTGGKRPGRYLVLFYAKAEGGPTRVGITVSGKVGKACERNAVKRRLKEALRLEVPPEDGGLELVFVAKRSAKGAPFEDIRRDIKGLLSGARKDSGPRRP